MRLILLLALGVAMAGCGDAQGAEAAPPQVAPCPQFLQKQETVVESHGIRVAGEDTLVNPDILRLPWSNDTGRLRSVEVTVTWTPSSPASESLWMVADFFADRAFQQSPSVEGPSPLSLIVEIKPEDHLRDMAWLDFMSSDRGLTMASIAVDQPVHVTFQESYACV